MMEGNKYGFQLSHKQIEESLERNREAINDIEKELLLLRQDKERESENPSLIKKILKEIARLEKRKGELFEIREHFSGMQNNGHSV